MYQGKHSAQPAGRARRGASPAHDVTPSRRRSARRHGGRPLALLLALILVVGAAAGGTVAWLTQTTETKNNNFEYGRVSCEVDEDFTPGGSTKQDVRITNTGNIPAYIRATYVVNWLDNDGHIAASVPEGYSYSLTENPDGTWTKGTDGYFYYLTPVAPGASTPGSLLTCTAVPPESPEYRLSVEILATAVQSAPADAVKAAWGSGFSIGSDGSLIVPGN